VNFTFRGGAVARQLLRLPRAPQKEQQTQDVTLGKLTARQFTDLGPEEPTNPMV
jgi:hypothetical protein